MTLSIKRRIRNLPAVHDCAHFGIWVRVDGKLVCRTCGKP